MNRLRQAIGFVAVILVLAVVVISSSAAQVAEKKDQKRVLLHEFGRGFILSLGGKLFDNLWTGTDLTPPKGTHPNYPKGLAASGPQTWRCIACHGWDYKGAEGMLGKVKKDPAFKSLRSLAGVDPNIIMEKFRKAPHNYPEGKLPNLTLDMLATFISYGQYDRDAYLDEAGKSRGDWKKGRDIYEGACMNCHQVDGRAYLEGEQGDKSSLGWIARNRPEQALHKIRNGVPGADMIAIRFLEDRQIIDLFAYLQHLDQREK